MTEYEYVTKHFDKEETVVIPDDAICVEKHEQTNNGRIVYIIVNYLEPV